MSSESGPLVINVSFEGDIELQQNLAAMAARGKNLTPVFLDFKGRMQRSISLNFRQGGRPKKWMPSGRAMGQGRGKGKTGQTLRDTGRLMNSTVGPGAYRTGADFLEISTNVKYARTHQKGAKKGSFGTFTCTVRAHKRKSGVHVREHTRTVQLPWGDIPAREFLLVQASDMNYLKAAIIRHLTVSGLNAGKISKGGAA